MQTAEDVLAILHGEESKDKKPRHQAAAPTSATKASPDMTADQILSSLSDSGPGAPAPAGQGATTDQGQGRSLFDISKMVLPAVGAGYLGELSRRKLTLPSGIVNMAYASRQADVAADAARRAHEANVLDLKRAKDVHGYLHSDQAIFDQMGMPAPAPEAPPSGLTRIPEGGTGTAEYARKFGATEAQALSAPSMSAVQQETIPRNVSAFRRAEEAFPGSQRFAESPFALFPETAQALQQETAQAREAAASQLAGHRQQSIFDLEEATARHQQSAANLAAAERNQAAIQSSFLGDVSRLSPSAQRAASALKAKSGALPSITRNVGRLLGRVAVPLAAATVPYETGESAEAFKKGDIYQGVKHGAGALGGALPAAGALALALGASPAIATGLATTGTIGALGVSASDLYDFLKENPEIAQSQRLHPPQ